MKTIEHAAQLAEALKAMTTMWDFGPKPQKFDATLSWRENDELGRGMARVALAAWDKHTADSRKLLRDDPLPDEIVGNDTIL